MTNHKDEAERLLVEAERLLVEARRQEWHRPADPQEHEYVRALQGQAQVHATLALASAQRATALIAAIDKWGGEPYSWPLAIREALGLNENGEKK